MSRKGSDHRALDLVVDGSDISQYVGPQVRCEETLAEWTVHTELICNEVTSSIFRPLKDRKVQIKYRFEVWNRHRPLAFRACCRQLASCTNRQ